MAGLHLLSLELGTLDIGAEIVGQGIGLLVVSREHVEGEFLSAVAENLIVTEMGLADIRDLAQCRIALLVAQIIVVGFKEIDVHDHDVLLFSSRIFLQRTVHEIEEVAVVVETRQGISVNRVGQGADLLPILFGVVAHGVGGHAEGTQQDDIRLEELTAQGGRNGEHIAGDDGAAGHDGKVQTEANAEVNGVEQDRQRENELVAADRHARADVAQHADGVHDGHLEERA